MTSDVEVIDSEHPLLACVRAAVAEFGLLPSNDRVDELLNEWNDR